MEIKDFLFETFRMALLTIVIFVFVLILSILLGILMGIFAGISSNMYYHMNPYNC
jgi:ABC-type proline/glycine betaine transport system permease subunit